MNGILAPLLNGVDLTGDLDIDVPAFLTKHGFAETAAHCQRVAFESQQLARRFNVDESSVYVAGLLHDVSAVFPNSERIHVARSLGLEILSEEVQFPLIIHQKISQAMAQELFGVEDELILNAIGCHTTLKLNPSRLDLVLFVADKISWDQSGIPPYLAELQNQLSISLEHAAFAYIQYLWSSQHNLRVVHPWLRDAYYQLLSRLRVTGSCAEAGDGDSGQQRLFDARSCP